MMRASTLAAAALILSLPAPTRAACPQQRLPESRTGKVVSIHDRGGLPILVDRTQQKVRLAAVDSAQRGQPFGTRAREPTGKQVFDKPAFNLCPCLNPNGLWKAGSTSRIRENFACPDSQGLPLFLHRLQHNQRQSANLYQPRMYGWEPRQD